MFSADRSEKAFGDGIRTRTVETPTLGNFRRERLLYLHERQLVFLLRTRRTEKQRYRMAFASALKTSMTIIEVFVVDDVPMRPARITETVQKLTCHRLSSIAL
jgi:hypothetical protein